MKKSSNIIDFSQIIEPVRDDINAIERNITQLESNTKADRHEINDLVQRIQELASVMKISIEDIPELDVEIETLNIKIDSLLRANEEFDNKTHSKFPKLSTQDIIVCSLVGVISVLIDVIFVGTPEVVKIYKGGENFDGSILTGALRKVGSVDNGVLSSLFKWFSDKCKVPYDMSCVSGVVTPDNHRLRSFSHDPFFGLLFAVADIILGTTTCIDNSGKLTVLVSPNKAPYIEKWLAIIYYLGHIVSDFCTARGIPIPGLFLTQFFTAETNNSSIAEIAEGMYKDGYDLRHMVSMSVPVFVKDILVNLYLRLTREEQDVITTIAEREKKELDFKLRTYKMLFIANSIGTIGNAAKFVSPPNCGNPCALNIVQWMAFIKDSITMIKASNRNFSAEVAMYNRQEIDAKWKELLQPNT